MVPLDFVSVALIRQRIPEIRKEGILAFES